MKKWKNITIDIPCLDLQLLIDYTSNLNEIYSVSVFDKLSEQESNWYNHNDYKKTINGDEHFLKFLVRHDYNSSKLIEIIKHFLNVNHTIKYHEEIFDDKNWILHTQNKFQPVYISKKLRIIPEWSKDMYFQGKTIIINPGLGFGTGSHPTTQLCLKWIEKNVNSNSTVLDYGSGSGILSIASKFYKANFVEGVEIDDKSIENAKQNNELNDVTINYHYSKTFKTNKRYNIILANILLPTLIELSPLFKKLARKQVVISGILSSQKDFLIESYDWIEMKEIDRIDEWVLIHGKLQ